MRWQSEATTPLSETAPGSQSRVALRFPPHSKSRGRGANRAGIYLDHNAATPVLPEVFEAMRPCFYEE